MADSRLVDAAAGAIAGVGALAITYPLLSASTKLSVHREGKRGGKAAKEKDATPTLLDLVRTHGLRALYSGLVPAALGNAATQAVFYYFYASGARFVRERRSLRTVLSLLNSAHAGAWTAVLTNPVWVCVTRMQVRAKRQQDATGQPTELSAIIREIFASDGLLGFWRGTGASLILVLNPIIQYTVFEALRRRFSQRGRIAVRPLTTFALAALAKIVATLLTYPYIVLKNRNQAGGEDAGTALRRLIANEGPTALYRGMREKIVQSVLNAALLFVLQDSFAKSLRKLAA